MVNHVFEHVEHPNFESKVLFYPESHMPVLEFCFLQTACVFPGIYNIFIRAKHRCLESYSKLISTACILYARNSRELNALFGSLTITAFHGHVWHWKVLTMKQLQEVFICLLLTFICTRSGHFSKVLNLWNLWISILQLKTWVAQWLYHRFSSLTLNRCVTASRKSATLSQTARQNTDKTPETSSVVF